MPPAPRRSSTSPGPGSGVSAGSIRKSSLACMRQAIMVALLRSGQGTAGSHKVDEASGAISISLQSQTRLVQRVPTLVEAFVRLIQMTLHGKPRGAGVVLRDRLQHKTMLGH